MLFFIDTSKLKKYFLSAVDNEWDPYVSLSGQASQLCSLALLPWHTYGSTVVWLLWHVTIWERLVVNWILENISTRNIYLQSLTCKNCTAILSFLNEQSTSNPGLLTCYPAHFICSFIAEYPSRIVIHPLLNPFNLRISYLPYISPFWYKPPDQFV